jgi:hypothetical protein
LAMWNWWLGNADMATGLDNWAMWTFPFAKWTWETGKVTWQNSQIEK